MSQWSAFGGLTWFLPGLRRLAARARAGSSSMATDGVHLEFPPLLRRLRVRDLRASRRRSRRAGRARDAAGPAAHAAHAAAGSGDDDRALPAQLSSDATPVGTFVGGVASREDYLRQLSAAGARGESTRVWRAPTVIETPDRAQRGRVDQSSGMSGFIFTPWAGVLSDRTVSLDYTHVPKEWSYSGRDEFVNQAYSLTWASFPDVKFNLRFTRLPGAEGFLPGDPRQSDLDRHGPHGERTFSTANPS